MNGLPGTEKSAAAQPTAGGGGLRTSALLERKAGLRVGALTTKKSYLILQTSSH
jgi:hypothetical protein